MELRQGQSPDGREVSDTWGNNGGNVLVLLVLVDDLDAMVILFSSRRVADRGEVAVHDVLSSWRKTRV